MIRYQIKNIINRHYRNLKKHFRKVKKHFDDEAIHQLRVEYKKLRAFIRLLSWQSGEKKTSKISGRLKRCYTIAGSIRDLQLQQKRLLEKSKTLKEQPEAYIHKLQKHINTLKPSLRKLLTKKTINKSKKKIKAIIPDVLGAEYLKSYFEKISQSVSSILNQETISDEDVHKVRKLLKDLSYNHKEIEKLDDNGFALSEYHPNNEEFDQLLEEIGNYIDKCNAINLLKPQWIGKLHKENQEPLSRIKMQLLLDKSELKHSLEQKLMNELPHAVT